MMIMFEQIVPKFDQIWSFRRWADESQASQSSWDVAVFTLSLSFVEIVWKNSYRSVVICCTRSEARDHEICLRTWSCKDKDGQIAQWIFLGHFRQDDMGRSHMLEQSQSIWCSSECGVPMESFSLCSQLGRHTNEVDTRFFCFDVLIWNYL